MFSNENYIVCGLSELFSCLSVVYFELICRVSFGVDWWFQIKGADSVECVARIHRRIR